VKSNRHNHSTTVGSLRTNGKTAQPQSRGTQAGGKVGLKDSQIGGHAGLKDSVVCLTSEQLQHILHSVHTSNQSQHTPEDPRSQDSKTGSLINGGGGSGEMKEEDRGGGTDNTATSQDKDNRLSGCPFSWLEERQTLSRATIDAKKAQWRRELDEQVALKQQQSLAPGRLQGMGAHAAYINKLYGPVDARRLPRRTKTRCFDDEPPDAQSALIRSQVLPPHCTTGHVDAPSPVHEGHRRCLRRNEAPIDTFIYGVYTIDTRHQIYGV
ncbi:uncharacterized protein, partial [Notothenia coriiceps]|uniref:Uncharacterized protein n=1 Tax=Notothenia coriiceps TaxID=8208 RepID=A0A6I9NTZ5_9TELE